MDADRADGGDPFEAALAALSPDQVAELRAALDALDSAGPPFATWSESYTTSSGATVLPYPEYSAAADRLRRAAGPLVVVFPWIDWSGFEAYEDPAALADAPVHDALRMVTRALRGERFSDGHLLEELDAGRLQAAVARVLAVVDPR